MKSLFFRKNQMLPGKTIPEVWKIAEKNHEVKNRINARKFYDVNVKTKKYQIHAFIEFLFKSSSSLIFVHIFM